MGQKEWPIVVCGECELDSVGRHLFLECVGAAGIVD